MLKDQIRSTNLNRVSYLIDNDDSKEIIIPYLEKLIEMVRYIKEHPEDKFIANRIKKNLNLTYNQVKIRSIIDDLDKLFPDFSL